MRIRDHLYFAPDTKFTDVNLTGDDLVMQVAKRIQGFYLNPARLLANNGHAFASGVMLLTAIDALARIQTGRDDVGGRIKDWCTANLPSYNEVISKRFYDDFRNGLVHEARIKNGGDFSLEGDETIQEMGDILSCNPLHLHDEIELALESFIQLLLEDSSKFEIFRQRICDDFSYEFNN